jgi:cytochrome bd-type quinol oxidase subunit 2
MKGNVDKPASRWESMFLPNALEDGIATLMISDETGGKAPFVSTKKIYNQAEGRTAIPELPPTRFPIGLIAGALLAALGYILLRAAEKKTAARRAFAVLSSLLSLIFGLAGTLLLFMAIFTDHTFTYWNQNLLFINPFLLVTLVLSIRLIFSKKARIKSVNICWMITAAGAAFSIILKVIPFCRQDNLTSILLLLLPAVVFSGLLRNIRTPA